MTISKFIQVDTRGLSLTREVILGVENVSKEFLGVKALGKISFRIGEAEIHCLVGENGFLA